MKFSRTFHSKVDNWTWVGSQDNKAMQLAFSAQGCLPFLCGEVPPNCFSTTYPTLFPCWQGPEQARKSLFHLPQGAGPLKGAGSATKAAEVKPIWTVCFQDHDRSDMGIGYNILQPQEKREDRSNKLRRSRAQGNVKQPALFLLWNTSYAK